MPKSTQILIIMRTYTRSLFYAFKYNADSCEHQVVKHNKATVLYTKSIQNDVFEADI